MTADAKIENNLFNDKKMEEFIQLYDDELTVNAECDPISYWIKKLDNDELRSEKTNYIRFFKIILENILGYEFTDIQYEENIGDEGRPVEFTLKKGDKDYVVVELKGTTCKDLNKRYNREQSPIEQVTNYASIKEETQWAFVSNYDEFRFFNPSYREKYISFKFKQLTDPNVLKRFLLIFSKFSLIDNDIPQILLKETRIIERELEDEFYKLFSETRLMLIKELEHSSENIDRIEAIRLSQLILNRFIFLCFAEDLRLIPSETTADVLLTPIKHKNLFEFTMWDRLNELFRFADKGNEERGIGSFNGGLFKESLRHLEIRDKIEDISFFNDCYKTWKFEEKYKEIESLLGVYKDNLNPIYKNLLLISSFDFGSELSVNILGHIFENSIGDIEELKDETTERRKKDGVYYTPEYITDYICRNTIIPYLSKNGKSKTTHELITEYENTCSLDELDKKLKDIKIIDMACGSGAFLNKAVDVLFEIHETLHTSKYAQDETLNKYFDSLDKRKQIIINNIYGVDINEESVEITKLSLFLKLATSTGFKEGFKLPNLDKNIKCGNSLVDDESIAGNKAFNWHQEFKEVFDNNAFDIILGNPPYIKETVNRSAFDGLRNSAYYQGRMDIWTFFGCVALDLIKDDGLIGFIAPNNWITNNGASKFRNKVNNEAKFERFIDFGNYKVFDSAEIQTMIYIMKKNDSDNRYVFNYCKILDDKLTQDEITSLLQMNSNTKKYVKFEATFDREINKDNYFNFIRKDIANILNKLSNKDVIYLEDNEISQGIVPNPDKVNSRNIKKINVKTIEKYNIKEGDNVFVFPKDSLENLTYFERQFVKPTYDPSDMNRYIFPNEYTKELLYLTPNNTNDIDLTSIKNILTHLTPYFDIMDDRRENKSGSRENYHLHWYRDETFFDTGEKILSVRKCETPTFVYTTEEAYVMLSFNVIKTERINLKYLTGLLNSRIIEFWLKYKGKMQGNNYQIDKEPLLKIPIKYEETEITEQIKNSVDYIIELNKNLLKEIKGFNKWLIRTFSPNIPMINNYYELKYDEFLLKLKENGVNIRTRETQELIENEFNKSTTIIKPLKNKINNVESKLNELTYQLYELTDDEIAIIENSFSE